MHCGHLHFLQKARELGDELVVVVATDKRVKELKHEPITPQEMRAELVGGLKPVDRAIVGREGDMFKVVEELKPDIIVLGYDQDHEPEQVRKALKDRGLDIQVVRLPKLTHELDGTRKIIRRIIDGYTFQKRMEALESTPAARRPKK